MIQLNRALLTTLPALLGLLGGSCVIPIGGGEVGDLRVTWSFDGSQRCAEVGVDTVTVQLIEKGQEGKDGALAFGQTAECIAGSMVIPEIAAGSYTMTVVGTGEVAVFDNEDGDTVDVAPSTLTEVSAPLVLKNGEVVARIELPYSFVGADTCGDAGVDTIDAQVIDENGVAIAGSATDCVAGLAVVEGIRLGDHTLRVEAIDGNGNTRFTGERALTGLQAGETLRLEALALTPALVDVTVNFSLGADSCADAGVDTVDVQVKDGARVVAAQTVACIDQRAVFTDLEPGNYTARLDAVDGNGEVLFSADDVALVVDGADGEGGDDIDVVLTATRALVTIPFVFPDNARCADLGVDNVDVQVIDADGNVTGVNVACVAGDSGPLVVVPGNATIRIDAIAGEDVAFSFDGTRVIAPGESTIAAIPLVAQLATLELRWDFLVRTDDNVADATAPLERTTTSCVDADVDTIVARVRDRATGVVLVAQAVDCDDARMELAGVRVGAVDVELEGVREQEGDAPFFIEAVVEVDAVNAAVDLTLEPNLAFVFVVWAGDCAAENAATVDIQVVAGGVNTGVNAPCAQGSQELVLPPGAELGPVTISLRGIDGQGVPQGEAERIQNVSVVTGLNTFRFAGPN
jgi:hypothetical protein